MVHTVKKDEPKKDSLNEAAYQVALNVFHSGHTSVHGALRNAIIAYRSMELAELIKSHDAAHLNIAVADTEIGPDTAIVITGFVNLAEAECFVARLHAPGK